MWLCTDLQLKLFNGRTVCYDLDFNACSRQLFISNLSVKIVRHSSITTSTSKTHKEIRRSLEDSLLNWSFFFFTLQFEEQILFLPSKQVHRNPFSIYLLQYYQILNKVTVTVTEKTAFVAWILRQRKKRERGGAASKPMIRNELN